MAAEIEFRAGDVTVDMVRGAWEEVLGEANEPGTQAHAEVERLSTDHTRLTADGITVEEKENDFGTTIVVVVVTQVGVHVVSSLWEDLVRPRIKAKFGVDAGTDVD